MPKILDRYSSASIPIWACEDADTKLLLDWLDTDAYSRTRRLVWTIKRNIELSTILSDMVDKNDCLEEENNHLRERIKAQDNLVAAAKLILEEFA